MPPISVGSPAPNFTLRDAHGERQSLSNFRGRAGGVVLYFYPEDDTPLCTAQACQFRDHHPDFSKIGCTILGISPDDQQSHADFTAKHHLPFTLLADEPDAKTSPPAPKVSTLYGAWGDKNMYGNIVRSMLRTTYLIAPNGKVARRWDRVKTPGHAAKVLAAVKELHAGNSLSILGEVKPVKSFAAKSRKAPEQRTRTPHPQGGRAAYSGVRAINGKKTRTPTRSTVTPAKAAQSRTRGKPR